MGRAGQECDEGQGAGDGAMRHWKQPAPWISPCESNLQLLVPRSIVHTLLLTARGAAWRVGESALQQKSLREATT